jgi:hypothetical protein
MESALIEPVPISDPEASFVLNRRVKYDHAVTISLKPSRTGPLKTSFSRQSILSIANIHCGRPYVTPLATKGRKLRAPAEETRGIWPLPQRRTRPAIIMS